MYYDPDDIVVIYCPECDETHNVICGEDKRPVCGADCVDEL